MTAFEYYQAGLSIIGGAVIVARAVVKFTPTPEDNTVVEKVVNVLKEIGLFSETLK